MAEEPTTKGTENTKGERVGSEARGQWGNKAMGQRVLVDSFTPSLAAPFTVPLVAKKEFTTRATEATKKT